MVTMQTLSLKRLDAQTYEVVVNAATPTEHIVSVTPAYAEKLAGGRMSVEELVRHSFDFLLEREPNTSILRRFDLSVIARYFPEYERVIGAKIG